MDRQIGRSFRNLARFPGLVVVPHQLYLAGTEKQPDRMLPPGMRLWSHNAGSVPEFGNLTRHRITTSAAKILKKNERPQASGFGGMPALSRRQRIPAGPTQGLKRR